MKKLSQNLIQNTSLLPVISEGFDLELLVLVYIAFNSRIISQNKIVVSDFW